MLKDFLNNKVNVTIAFGDRMASVKQIKGVLTACEEDYIKLDNNIILSTRFILSVIINE